MALTLVTGFASAQQAAVSVNANAGANAQAASSTITITGTVQTDSGASAKKNDKASANATTTGNRASITGKEHMSVVARFVQSLQLIANREGGIGAQVRAIAQAQNDTASSSVAAIAKLESRGKLRTFFFGTDYKSVGQLRSDIATTQANLENLQKLVERAVSTSTKAELQAQISALQASQVSLNAFLKAHESTFSLFGWFNKE